MNPTPKSKKARLSSRTKSAISRLLKGLPIVKESRKLIDAAANSIVQTAILTQEYLEISDEFDSSTAGIELRKLLRDIHGHVGQLITAIEQLPLNTFDEARMALRTRPMGEAVIYPRSNTSLPPKKRLLADLRRLSEVSELALRSRRTGNRLASEVTNAVALAYTALTGKRPARSNNAYTGEHSEFEELLAAIFVVLGITASAERQARNLATDRRRPRHLARLLMDGKGHLAQ